MENNYTHSPLLESEVTRQDIDSYLKQNSLGSKGGDEQAMEQSKSVHDEKDSSNNGGFFKKTLQSGLRFLNDENVEPNYSIKSFIKFCPIFWVYSLPISFNFVGPSVLITVYLIMVSWYKDATLSAGIGIGNSLYQFFFFIMTQANNELVGIQCAKCNGAKNYALLRQTFFKSVVIAYMVFLFGLCFYIRIDLFLEAIGFLDDVAKNAHIAILCAIPAIFIQAYTEVLKSYLISQGATSAFLYLNIVLMCLYPILLYIFVWVCNLPLASFGLVMLFREVATVIVYSIVVSKLENPELNFMSRENRTSLKEVSKGLGGQICSFLKLWPTVFLPYFCFAATTVMVGDLKDNNYTAAYAIASTCGGINYCLAGGMGQTCRTAVSNFIGKEKNMKAKEYAFKAVASNLTYTLITGSICIFCRFSIARVFSDVVQLEIDIEKMLMIYGFIAITDGTMNINSSLMRIMGYANTSSIVFMVNGLIIFDGLSQLFLFVQGMPGYTVMYAFLTANSQTFIIFISIIFYFGDWNKIKKETA